MTTAARKHFFSLWNVCINAASHFSCMRESYVCAMHKPGNEFGSFVRSSSPARRKTVSLLYEVVNPISLGDQQLQRHCSVIRVLLSPLSLISDVLFSRSPPTA